MEISKEALTAVITAFGRAYHSLHDNPKIFDDFLAKFMMTDETYNFIGHNMANSLEFFGPEFAVTKPSKEQALSYLMKVQTTPISLCRSRYTEDFLETAVERGYSQYVILGAGMDTFAFRKPELIKKLAVYELDQPVTQEYKLSRLKKLGWDIPEQLHMIPVDFSRDDFTEALAHAGYDSGQPGVFSWLGVTYYLDRDDVISVFAKMADIAASGSILIFDYMDMEAFDEKKVSWRAKKMMEAVGRAGEPMKTGFNPAELKTLLAASGLLLVGDMSPDAIQRAYFEGRRDGYSAFEHIHIAKVKVI